MSHVIVSTVIDAPIEDVWAVLRKFNGLQEWVPGIESCVMENGSNGTAVGGVRLMKFSGSPHTFREELVAMSDADFTVTYKVLEGALPVKNVVTTIALRRVTDTNQTFGEWSSEFDCRPGREQDDLAFLPKLFAGSWKSLKKHISGGK